MRIGKRLFGFAATLALTTACLSTAAAVVIVGAAVAIGTYAYLDGEGSQDYAVTVEQAYLAAVRVCERSSLTVVDRSSDAFSAWIVARMADGTTVRFHMRRLEERFVHVGIRVGVMGDYGLTLTLHQRLGAELDAAAEPPKG